MSKPTKIYMDAEQIKEFLADGICKFEYTKKNGEKRVAVGTRNKDLLGTLIPDTLGDDGYLDRAPKTGAISYYDIGSAGWRSFLPDRAGKVLVIFDYESSRQILESGTMLEILF